MTDKPVHIELARRILRNTKVSGKEKRFQEKWNSLRALTLSSNILRLKLYLEREIRVHQ